MLTKTLTLHAINGEILWHFHASPQGFGASRVVGSRPWDWIHPADTHAVKVAFALAVIGEQESPVRYRLDPSTFSDQWVVETLWQRVPATDATLIGISSTWHATVESLTAREREVAKLLPDYATKEIAKRLDLSSRSVEAVRHRIVAKIGDGNLIAWCTAHRDIL